MRGIETVISILGGSDVIAPMAQLVERCTCNAKVRCSNQRGGSLPNVKLFLHLATKLVPSAVYSHMPTQANHTIWGLHAWYQALLSEALCTAGGISSYFTLACYVVDSNVNVSLRKFDCCAVTSPRKAEIILISSSRKAVVIGDTEIDPVVPNRPNLSLP